MKQGFLIFFLIFLSAQGFSQDRNSRNPNINRKASLENEALPEKAPIELYKIISVENDTTHVDTSLTIYKDYKFNYLRKDNFGLLEFSNVGRPYNRLTYDFIEEQHILPQFGAQARHFNFMEVDDIFYYHVPTPLTELFFKTTFEQGQLVDALFTVNTSEQLNLSIAYKGLRSLGQYQHMLTSTGNFRATISYSSKNDRYGLKTHFVSQDLLNQENGGLTPNSLTQYLAKNPEFDDRARLDVNFENAESTLFGKRFYLDHHYNLFQKKDSLAPKAFAVGHKINHTYKKYQFEQSAANDLFGPSFEQTNLRDQARLTSTYNELYLSFAAVKLGQVVARGGVTHYDYGYNTLLDLEDGFIVNRLQGDIVSAGGSYRGQLAGLEFEAEGDLNLVGDFKGYNVSSSLSYELTPDISLAAMANVNDRAPNYNFLLNQSDYINYNWQTEFSNESRQSLGVALKAPGLVDGLFEFSTINDMAFFALNEEGLVKPFQFEDQVSVFKIQGQREFRLGKFALNNTLLYQNVLDGQEVLNVPEFVTRNTLYYSDHWFRRALYLQTGFTLNYFTNYQMNGYDPVLAEFYVQNEVEFEGFPTVDFFFNGKIRQARIFFKLEHINSIFQGNNNFSAPLYPYRDFSLRFGLVWNMFM
ncbi:putative porin [Salinimicrobium oceani]|uniref:Porin n=1 Tax=Salinimicrobium oceani TaxID=2722702 RepID=A0ABX1CY38_9FLAO|nr:putative porin [Salinimicrobium oceani]NJW53172.1 putative porin [Salinimicrobium oceani]